MVIGDFVTGAGQALSGLAPWQATSSAPHIVRTFVAAAGPDYVISGETAVHRSATVEDGALLKGPCLIGPGCFIASSALLRGGVWLEGDDIIGPACELKTVFMFAGSKAAHLNFVGDSVIGRDVNIEAGAVIANYRNEKTDKIIRFRQNGQMIDTGVDKFGAILGDHVRIGANAVIAPGAALNRGQIVGRLALVDQS